MHPVRESVVHWTRYEGNTIAMSKKAFEKKNSSGLKIFCIFAIELLQKSRNEKKRNMENPFKFGTIVDSYSLGGGLERIASIQYPQQRRPHPPLFMKHWTSC